MKNSCMLVLALLMAFACQTTSPSQRSTSTAPFAHYRSLADALRTYPGLLVSGARGQEQIVLRHFVSTKSAEPLYVINGQPIGNNYFGANQLLDMVHVKQIRIIKGSSESARFGSLGSGGVILIDTL